MKTYLMTENSSLAQDSREQQRNSENSPYTTYKKYITNAYNYAQL